MYRERLTITLDPDLLAAVDSLIDKEKLRNRSQTIEHLLREGVGLHALNKAFIFLSPELNQAELENTLRICAKSGIFEIFLGIPSSLRSQESELLALAREASGPDTTVETVPMDFGSAGAVILKKDRLASPFVVSFPQDAPLPASLVGAYLFHRSHHGPLTELISISKGTYLPSGLRILSPEVIDRIPAGISDLRDSVFPDLAKEAKVKGYLYEV